MNDRIMLGAISLLVIALVSTIAIVATIIYKPIYVDNTLLTVGKGESANTIAANLKARGLIRNRQIFLVLVKLSRTDRTLKKGTYVFGGKLNMPEAIRILKEGKSATIDISIPEGFSLFKTLKKIDQSGLASFAELSQLATDPAVVKQLTGFEAKSLEGFLYPETYRFDIGLEPLQILKIQTEHFFKRITQAELMVGEKDDFYRQMILASIVEKEAVMEDEKSVIAGVFLNRIAKGMKLESCPTVDYILEPQGIKKAILSYEDTSIPSPYNTYLSEGLPPTPICTPTVSSLLAVQTPAIHRYLCFFADNKGRNIFSGSYEEHLQRQRQHRAKARIEAAQKTHTGRVP